MKRLLMTVSLFICISGISHAGNDWRQFMNSIDPVVQTITASGLGSFGSLTVTGQSTLGNVAISSCVVTGTVGNVLTTNGAVFFGGNATLKLNSDLVFGYGETINNDTDGSIGFTNNGSASLSLVHGSEAYFNPAANIPFGINAPNAGQGVWLRAGVNTLELNTTTGKIQFGGTSGAKSWLYGNSGYTIWAGSMAIASEQVYASTFTPNSFDCGTDITALTKTIKCGYGVFTSSVTVGGVLTLTGSATLPTTGYPAGSTYYETDTCTFWGSTEPVVGAQSWIRIGKPGD